MTRRAYFFATLSMLLAAFASPAMADGGREYRLYIENDAIDPIGDGSDRFYTNGLRIETTRYDKAADDAVLFSLDHGDVCDLLCTDDRIGTRFASGWALGQNMYTPGDISIARPQPFDRPWAGVLYGSRFAQAGYELPGKNLERQDRIEALLGVVGPPSLAGPVQRGWHALWGFQRPEGWDNQLKTEPVLQLQYSTALRWPATERANFDVIPRMRINAGTLAVSIEAETMFRVGHNLSGFGVQAIPLPAPPTPMTAQLQKASDADAAAIAAPRNAWQPPRSRSDWFDTWFLFARSGTKLVAHNLLLDGNIFHSNDIRIDRTPVVGELAAGIEVNVWKPLWVTFQHVRRSSEFGNKFGEAPGHGFSSFTLAWRSGI